ncbi:MAG: hypothetical protein ACK5LL_03830 [Suipraeoptans sp.]
MKRIVMKLLCLSVVVSMLQPLTANAETLDDVFDNAKWELAFENSLEGGIVQSICVTDEFIVTIENIDDSTDTPDILKAYYKNDKDRDGNSVEKYSLAKRIESMHYEHCNGMAYNPNTNEIAISLYTNVEPDNRGSIYILDGNTLEYVRTVKITDDYNILGIGYDDSTDRYAILTNIEGGFSFKLLDSQFNVIEDLGQYAETLVGGDFQDIYFKDDTIITFPLTLGMGIGEYIYTYSVSGRAQTGSYPLNFEYDNVKWSEPESICELEPGVFIAAVNVEDEGDRKIRFYRTPIQEETPAAVPEPEELKTEVSPQITENPEIESNEELQVNKAAVPIGQSISPKNIISTSIIVIIVMILMAFLFLYSRLIGARRERKIVKAQKRRRYISESYIVAEED